MPKLSDLAFRTISRGVRLPRLKPIAAFDQWSALIDLIERLGVNIFLDVGANRGFYSKHLRDCGYKGKLFSFEPIQSECDQIEAKAAGDPNWKVFRTALGAKNGTQQFNLSRLEDNQTVLSSFLPRKGGPNAVTQVTVEVMRLDSLIPSIVTGVEDPRIFLKMDTQGFDLQVVEGGAGCLHLVVGIQSEISVVPLYEDMPSYTESLAKYHDLGFQLNDLFVVNRTATGCVLEYDCLMSRCQAHFSRAQVNFNR
jgi:FkbM family methyltransferase